MTDNDLPQAVAVEWYAPDRPVNGTVSVRSTAQEEQTEMDGDDLIWGARYDVELNDCCVQGEFTATLVETADDGRVLLFDNGVRLDSIGGVSLTRVEHDEEDD